ncbi:putative thiamine biosynthesis protein [Microbacterium azadirachtae]|uniref:Putative thiamine biosynthesis protein n=1 Tax=Microbacterium azadirachtae TaxID=582680 RepID=A0A0F0L0J9_9MICO|nr:ABC transporter substrate-binding protein [Microbacterium azadirachtae]KJL26638.1 putative thiamine biosynthesis protein [Microbacterium azadirachtae]
MTTRLSLALEYFHPWPNAAGFYVAREHGWYHDLGIELEIRTVDPGLGDTLEHVHTGRADLGVFPTNRLLVRRERGEPIQAIAAVNQRGLETIRTLESSGIRSLADLAGRRLALNPTPRGLAIVRDLITRAGADPDQVELIDVGARELTADDLEAGLADATFGSYWSWDILLSERADRPERVWRVDEELGIQYHSYLLGGLSNSLDTGLVKRFLQATEAGFAHAAHHQDAATALFARVTPYFPHQIIRRSMQLVAPTWFHDGQWGTIRAEAMAPYAHWLASKKILARPTEWPSAIAATLAADSPETAA